jgi:hypothetical protein
MVVRSQEEYRHSLHQNLGKAGNTRKFWRLTLHNRFKIIIAFRHFQVYLPFILWNTILPSCVLYLKKIAFSIPDCSILILNPKYPRIFWTLIVPAPEFHFDAFTVWSLANSKASHLQELHKRHFKETDLQNFSCYSFHATCLPNSKAEASFT